MARETYIACSVGASRLPPASVSSIVSVMPDLSQRTITPAPPTDSTQKVVREQAISQAAAAYLAALDRANQTGPATEVTGPATGTTTE